MKKCSVHGKKIHPTQKSAIRGAINASRKRGTPLRTYYDPVCKCWHLTSRRKWEDAA